MTKNVIKFGIWKYIFVRYTGSNLICEIKYDKNCVVLYRHIDKP